MFIYNSPKLQQAKFPSAGEGMNEYYSTMKEEIATGMCNNKSQFQR